MQKYNNKTDILQGILHALHELSYTAQYLLKDQWL